MSKDDVRQHRLSFLLSLEGGADERAPGGAVTVSLCGHWEHEGPCRWPHLSSISRTKSGLHQLVVEFDAPLEEVEEVRRRVTQQLRRGTLTGPDGKRSRWTLDCVVVP